MAVPRTNPGVSRIAFCTVLATLAGSAIAATPPQQTTITLPGNVPLVLIRIPPGSIQMGSPGTERSRHTDEGPVHNVTIGYGLYMGKYEVTQKQWLALVGGWPDSTLRPNATNGLGDGYPAYYVSWNDALNFITALNAHVTRTGQGPAVFRLPSEAEWEYACRARATTRFYFGDSLSVDDLATDGAAGTLPGSRSHYMWFGANNGAAGSPQYGSKVVGTKLPNPFSLYDMSGNVLEWCQDWYHDNYTGAPANGSAWEIPVGSYRVVRGGDWSAPAAYCRSAHRDFNTPGARHFLIGFRVAWAPPPARATEAWLQYE